MHACMAAMPVQPQMLMLLMTGWYGDHQPEIISTQAAACGGKLAREWRYANKVPDM